MFSSIIKKLIDEETRSFEKINTAVKYSHTKSTVLILICYQLKIFYQLDTSAAWCEILKMGLPQFYLPSSLNLFSDNRQSSQVEVTLFDNTFNKV